MTRSHASNILEKPTSNTPCLALRQRDAAAALGVCERTLWQWTKDGSIPHIRRKGTILYPIDVLRRWLDEHATTESCDESAEASDATN